MRKEELMIGDMVRVVGCPNVFHIGQIGKDFAVMREHPDLTFPYYNLREIPINDYIMQVNRIKPDRVKGIPLWQLTKNIKLTDDFGIYIYLEKVKFNFVHELQHFLRLCGEEQMADNLRAI